MKTLNVLALGALLIGLHGALKAAPDADLPEASCVEGVGKRVAAALGRAGASELRIACKAMPSDPGRSIVALAYLDRRLSEGELPEGDFDLDVLIVDSGNAKVLRKLHLPGAIVSDAVVFSGLGIDTANYRLAPGVRAFGLTVGHHGSSRANPYGSNELLLFVEQHGALRRVLEHLYVKQDGGEWDTDCAGQFTDVVRTVAVGKAGAQGFADLLVTTRTNVSDNKPGAEDCIEVKHAPMISKNTLRYRGDRYQTLEEAAR